MIGIKAPQTLNEFAAIVRDFASASLAELEARWAIGERNFIIELMLDRTRFAEEVRLYWFQQLWYDITERALEGKPYARSYADYLSRYGGKDENYAELHDRNIMVYRLSVGSDDSGSSSSAANPIEAPAACILTRTH